jgi:hypothetical protein
MQNVKSKMVAHRKIKQTESGQEKLFIHTAG